LKEALGENSMWRTTVFDWHKKFCDGREDVVQNARPGRPMSMRTSEILTKMCGKIDGCQEE